MENYLELVIDKMNIHGGGVSLGHPVRKFIFLFFNLIYSFTDWNVRCKTCGSFMS